MPGGSGMTTSTVVNFPERRRPELATHRQLVDGIARLTAHVAGALQALQLDDQLARIAGDRLPDAAARLDHVVKLTNDAAHRTLDLVEQSRGAVTRLNRVASELSEMRSETVKPTPYALGRLQDEIAFSTELLRQNLADMSLAQGYQDLTGQIVGRAVKLIHDVEHALVDLLGAAGIALAAAPPGADTDGKILDGPAVPGVSKSAVDQKDADSLLSDLGI